MEIKMKRITKYNKEKADEAMARMKDEVARIDKELSNMVKVTINWFKKLKDKYGDAYPRRTEIKTFDTIIANKVVEANQKLYINKADGFIGTGLKKDEYVTNCSDMDDIILFYKDGRYKIVKVAEKIFVGPGVIYLDVFKKNDKRTIYNVVYRDGKNGAYYMKRFAATGLTRDKEYDLTQGKPNSKVMYFTANHNGEAEVIKITLKPNPKLKKPIFDKDFSELLIKGRQSMGNLLTRNEVQKVTLKSHGGSTLGGRKVWFDRDILRLDFEGHGEYLGEFDKDDLLLVVLDNGEFYTTEVDPNCHFDANILKLEKFDIAKVWTALLYDGSQKGMLYMKRFNMEITAKRKNLLGEDKNSKLALLTDTVYPRILVNFGGADSFREPLELDAEEFIAVKGYKARGRRVSTFKIASVEELEPLRMPEVVEPELPESADIDESENDNSNSEDNEQLVLFE
jgi:topoisomerase-4 subunit A